MNDNRGPRDWTPAYGPSVSSGFGSAAPARSILRESVISLLTGIVAVGLGIAPFTGLHLSWVFSTVGITAIATGIAALTRSRGFDLGSRILPMLGLGFGVLGTLLMVSGIVLHGVVAASPTSPQAVVGAQAGGSATSGDSSWTRDGARVTAMQLAQVEGTIVYLLEHDHDTFGSYPTAFQSADGIVATTSGTVRLPAGTTMTYSRWSDGTGYELQLAAGTAEVVYSTSTGSIGIVSQ